MVGQGDAQGCSDPEEAHAGAGSWQDLWIHGERSPHWSMVLAGFVDTWREEPTLEHGPGRICDPTQETRWSSLLWRTAAHGKGSTLEQFAENSMGAAHGKDSHQGSSWRTVSRGRDPMLEQGRSVRDPSPRRKELQRGCVM
ncbi:hypothetical protein DUI87_26722 [Hirundo rustica rustica]|uniref:Uncharacterized protein n=1 Tax=Hirundo rustica rustica TaxID=333673 RepID=A0A3M0J6E2_HIRRU|nr:hypothetical protein DUI87_26722 [Hirundo rustica rustica]